MRLNFNQGHCWVPLPPRLELSNITAQCILFFFLFPHLLDLLLLVLVNQSASEAPGSLGTVSFVPDVPSPEGWGTQASFPETG